MLATGVGRSVSWGGDRRGDTPPTTHSLPSTDSSERRWVHRTQVEFFVRADGVVELRPLNVDLAAWFGRIPGRTHVDVADMDPGSEP